MAERFRPHRGIVDTRENIIQSNKAHGQVQMAMLVDVPEFFKNHKRLPFGSILPCDKRLQRLDVFGETWPDSPEIFSRGLRPTRRFNDNWKANITPPRIIRERVCGRASLLEDSQLPDEIVKGRPKVIDCISDEQSPFPEGSILADSASHNILASIRVQNNFNSICPTTDKTVDGICQIPDMDDRPLQFGTEIIRRKRRGGSGEDGLC